MSIPPNGNHVTRAELGTHLKSIDGRLEKIEELLDAKPGWFWVVGRWTNVVDKLVPAAVVAGLTYLGTQLI